MNNLVPWWFLQNWGIREIMMERTSLIVFSTTVFVRTKGFFLFCIVEKWVAPKEYYVIPTSVAIT